MTKDFLLENVSKEYKGEGYTTTALHSVSLKIPHNKINVITGPSGSGKSTLLTLLGALDTPSNGNIYYGDQLLDGFSSKRLSTFRFEEIGFVFQQFHLLSSLTAIENVLSPMFPYRKRNSMIARAEKLMDRMGLKDKAGSLPSQLSGGQQQRVAIARALINNPSWILADEPTGNLDSASSMNIMTLLKEIQEENQCGVIMVTHDQNLAGNAHRVIEVQDGKVLEAHAL
jgi:ABC-type lipoprotein export system ATPase subunit